MSAILEADPSAIESKSPDSVGDEVRSSGESRRKTLWKYAGSLFDQSLVSGTRFAISILIGAVCGAAELGLYAIGFSILMALHAVQISLICRPFAICGNQMDRSDRQELAGSGLVQFAVFGALAGGGLAAAAALVAWFAAASPLVPVLLILAIGAPVMLWREHARQYCFAQLQVKSLTLVDICGTAVQLAGLAWLVWTQQLTAVTALGTSAIAAAVAGALWFRLARRELHFDPERFLVDLQSHWRIGRWDCASEVAHSLQIYGTTWLMAAMLDTTRVGIYAACMMSIQILNPFLLGMTSLLVPRTARVFGDSGMAGLRIFVRQTTIVLGSFTAVFAVAAVIWGPAALELIYSGQGFDIPRAVVALLVLSVVVDVTGIGAENGVWAMSRHDLNFRVQLAGSLVTCLAAYPLISAYGLTGTALAYLLGCLATTTAQWAAYRLAADEEQAAR